VNLVTFVISYGRGKTTLLYGEAGSGKTNLALYILSIIAKKLPSHMHFFISSEGSLFKHLIDRYKLGNLDNVLFSEVINGEHLLSTIIDIALNYKGKLGSIIIDSVNNFYRDEVLYHKDANLILNTIMSLITSLASSTRSYSIVTAQVRQKPEGGVEISGSQILMFWSDIVMKLSKEDEFKVLEVIHPNLFRGAKMKFVIGSGGVEIIE